MKLEKRNTFFLKLAEELHFKEAEGNHAQKMGKSWKEWDFSPLGHAMVNGKIPSTKGFLRNFSCMSRLH